MSTDRVNQSAILIMNLQELLQNCLVEGHKHIRVLCDEMVKEDSHFETSQISTRTDTGTIAEAHEGNLASIRTLFKTNAPCSVSSVN